MPGYRDATPLPAPRVRGHIEDVPFASEHGPRRRIRAYLPPSDRRPLPVLYVHDGDIVLDKLGLPSVLDALIDAGEMTPVIAVFIDSVDRHEDYEPGSPLRSLLTHDIVPLIQRRYGSDPNHRVLLGVSRSTVGALDTCVNGGIAFDACALVAAAIPARQLPKLLPAAGAGRRFFVTTGTYDIPLVSDARALHREMQARGLDVRYVETPEGHNHTAFRARLPALMRELFPR
jgi:enterochelin esterase family protein